MENITLGQIVALISFIGVFIGGITAIIKFLKSFFKKLLQPINDKIEDLQNYSTKSRNNIELELLKTILVNYIDDMEQGNHKSQIQKQNAFELYDRYQKLGGNSYVHDRWEKLVKEEKI